MGFQSDVGYYMMWSSTTTVAETLIETKPSSVGESRARRGRCDAIAIAARHDGRWFFDDDHHRVFA